MKTKAKAKATLEAYTIYMKFAFHDRKKIIDFAVRRELEYRATEQSASAWIDFDPDRPVPAEDLAAYYESDFTAALAWFVQEVESFIDEELEEEFGCEQLGSAIGLAHSEECDESTRKEHPNSDAIRS